MQPTTACLASIIINGAFVKIEIKEHDLMYVLEPVYLHYEGKVEIYNFDLVPML